MVPAPATAPGDDDAAAVRPGPLPAARARAWLLPVLFAAFCAVTLWCAVALLADWWGVSSSPARRVAPVAAVSVRAG